MTTKATPINANIPISLNPNVLQGTISSVLSNEQLEGRAGLAAPNAAHDTLDSAQIFGTELCETEADLMRAVVAQCSGRTGALGKSEDEPRL